MRRTLARIDLRNLAFNLRSCRQFIGTDVKCMAVVKANAYGHGAVECARRLEAEGVDWFGVALIDEGVELRDAGIKTPILCLGGSVPGEEKDFLDAGITPVVFNIDSARRFDRLATDRSVRANVHIKIDTGMGRLGVRWDHVDAFISELTLLENLHVEGLMTHFAVADDLGQNEFTEVQIDRFERALHAFESAGIRPDVVDIANSPGAVVHPHSRKQMVRLGGVMYGLADDVLPRGTERPVLRPVMSLRSTVADLKCIPTGDTVGYGRTFTAARDLTVALIPIGYHDGYRRALSNKSRVIINGGFAPVIGRISMDWTIVDVTDIPQTKIGADVTLIGSSDGLHITAEDLASLAGTISYEITCGISHRVPREYLT